MINMEDILARLQNGEHIEDIGNEIAGIMNQAVAAHNAELEAAAKRQAEVAKRDLIAELVDIIRELALLEGMDPEDLQVTDEDMDQLVEAFTGMFAAMRDLKKMLVSIEVGEKSAAKPAHTIVKRPAHAPSDEQILADFIKMFN